jgi:hypothetical protein
MMYGVHVDDRLQVVFGESDNPLGSIHGISNGGGRDKGARRRVVFTEAIGMRGLLPDIERLMPVPKTSFPIPLGGTFRRLATQV